MALPTSHFTDHEAWTEPWRYRNKAQFPFGRNKNGEIVTDSFMQATPTILSQQEDCLLGVEENKKILESIKEYMIENHVAPLRRNPSGPDPPRPDPERLQNRRTDGLRDHQWQNCLTVRKLVESYAGSMAWPASATASTPIRPNVILWQGVSKFSGQAISPTISVTSNTVFPHYPSTRWTLVQTAGGCTEPPWSMRPLLVEKWCGICTSESEPFPYSWHRKRRRSTAWDRSPGNWWCKRKRKIKWPRQCGILRRQSRGSASGAVWEE